MVSIDINPVTFEFAKKNLEDAGYDEIILVRSDGGLGYPELAPYDRICITAACPDIPPPLIDQLKTGGKLIAPVIREEIQELVLLEKSEERLDRRVICEVLYVNLRGIFG